MAEKKDNIKVLTRKKYRLIDVIYLDKKDLTILKFYDGRNNVITKFLNGKHDEGFNKLIGQIFIYVEGIKQE